jgi:signal transduction histidine kinase/DNA-binding response OmpR family regulator
MNLKNIKIATQLKLGFSALLLFVIVLGAVSYIQTIKIDEQVEIMYDHPFKVRRALGTLESDILKMRLGTRDLMLARNLEEKQAAVQLIELSAADAHKQFTVLENQYLGPRNDVEEAYKAFVKWKTAREINNKLALSGEIEKVKESVLSSGPVGMYREQMLAKIKIIDDFAKKKTEALYANSNELNESLNRQLILLVGVILLLSLIINIILLRNIRKPLKDLTNAARDFQEGDMDARSAYRLNNEFGELSASFNSLAESIQTNTDLDKKIASLAGLMLSEYDAKKFFQATLNALAKHTGSQMAAIYLLSSDKKTFEHFESTGVDDNARQSFASDSFEGEFGSAISSRKVQHIQNIPDDTRFTFHTVSGTFIPHEIITLPIIADNEVIAIISLATVSYYSKQSIELIDSILVTLCARIEGIMSYHKMKEFSEQLDQQNRELESQKTELTSQSAELMTQNSELEMQKKQLDEASRLKTNFLSNMSHELRTPLNSVIALSGVLNRRLARKIPEEEFSYLEVIERNGKHLLSLINDILDISRIEAGREELEITKFNVNSLVAEVTDMIQPQAEQRNIGLLHTDNEANLPITSDVDKCRHILQNLIGNAVKFTEEGTVTVSARQHEKDIQITITDTGIGIDETNLAHIFDEFRQADSSTSRRFGGTGLGLAIAKKYANLLGGTISVMSRPGKGSEFTFTLPLRYATENRIIVTQPAAALKNTLKKPSHQPLSASTVKTILLVEDSEPAIIQMKDMLEESGYKILVAHDGAEALAIINQTVPDAMILDLMMPGIDGFEVLKVIREAERTAHIPVLILTAKHITKEDLKFLKRNNVHQLIQKGDVNRGELQSAVERMVSPPETVEVMKPQREMQIIEGKPVVLIVEDNPDNMITAKALLGGNYNVIEAIEGKNGVEMARQHKPHLILMDIALPGIDGIQAFKVIRNDPRLQHIPVIALTASAMISDRETILAHGFDSYIAKPIDEQMFFRAIHEALYGE